MDNVTNAADGHDTVLALDERAIQRQFSRLAATYDATSLLQQQVADELIDRIELVHPGPTSLLDLGSGTGYLGRRAKERFPGLSIIAVDRVKAMAIKVANADPDADVVITSAEKLAMAKESIPLVLSNLLLHWCDVGVVFSEVADVLEIGGTFLFSTLGPDTLLELRTAWAQVDDYPHVHAFIDMHNLGDALITAGFSEPVLDTDRVKVTYETAPQLIDGLRCLGAINARGDRRRTFLGKRRYARFLSACESFRKQGRLSLTWEVIYGLATKDRIIDELSIPVITLPEKKG